MLGRIRISKTGGLPYSNTSIYEVIKCSTQNIFVLIIGTDVTLPKYNSWRQRRCIKWCDDMETAFR